MIPREFGRSGIKLSPVTFGSMRLDPKRIELNRAVELITYLYNRGVNTFHSSHEYDTDAFFCRALGQFKAQNSGAEIKHIAKIGVPHFGESEFSSAKLITLVENRLRDLNTERIDLVQWLVRHQPNEDRYRLPILLACQQELQTTWSKLQQEGKVGALASFPYSLPFAEAVLQLPHCMGLVTYLNFLELEMAPLLKSMAANGQGYVAIRPLAGGSLVSSYIERESTGSREKSRKIMAALDISIKDVVKSAIQFPLLHPVVASVMVSVSTIAHAEEIIIAVADLERDRSNLSNVSSHDFDRVWESVRQDV